jgi:hypothetical protein
MTRSRLLPFALVLALAALATLAARAPIGPPAALAATCASFANQAQAQLAADTRDGDGDGIYCEALPCPCSGGRSAVAPAPRSQAPAPLGRSIALGPVTGRGSCRIRGSLPDAGCTPGARFEKVTKEQVCRPGYARSARNVSRATKDSVYGAYGMRRHFNGSDGEVDHLVSLELGGSNVRANLFPEAAAPSPGSHEKDRLENSLHADVCSGAIGLRQAQRLNAHNWVAAYRARLR